ncbi:LysR family transcriptional regulator [Frateuria terrea]|uniref:DNA-binding transcriptional regulator, LysR family n=1 Tax=Frateuria terrea TaxID=529704 RepID=A0A1H6UF92_9GAMM|nr:LysR family transcriptional regulator [Frateuria terrea]SEI88347.1 DNA-binding transcriptional regulator, LysR family [Frateuria terrea]SFP37776.1 DNA-binding transcriptional regulator, LysR family [Frateuria terrea]
MGDRVAEVGLFLRVLDLGSISAAARSLDISVVVASQRLKRLERELGVRLLHRTTRRLHPTPEGILLAEKGRALIEELDSLTEGLRSAAGEVSGTLRVTAPATFGRQHVSPLLPQFLAAHPKLRLSIDLTDQVVDLVSAGYDLAIRFGGLVDSSLVARKLATNRRILCASPGYLRVHGAPQTPAELANHACILLSGARGRRDVWCLRDRQGKETVVHVSGRIESNYNEVIRDAVLAGLGIALHSMWHVYDDLLAGRMQRVLPEYEVPASEIYAVKPGRGQVPPRVRAFEDFLIKHFGHEPSWDRVDGA